MYPLGRVFRPSRDTSQRSPVMLFLAAQVAELLWGGAYHWSLPHRGNLIPYWSLFLCYFVSFSHAIGHDPYGSHGVTWGHHQGGWPNHRKTTESSHHQNSIIIAHVWEMSPMIISSLARSCGWSLYIYIAYAVFEAKLPTAIPKTKLGSLPPICSLVMRM